MAFAGTADGREKDVLEIYVAVEADVEHLIQSEMKLIEANKVLDDGKVPATGQQD